MTHQPPSAPPQLVPGPLHWSSHHNNDQSTMTKLSSCHSCSTHTNTSPEAVAVVTLRYTHVSTPAHSDGGWTVVQSCQNEVHYQLVPRTSMDKTQQNEPSDVLKTTSLWVLTAQTKIGPCISDADFYHNAQQLSTYYATRRSTTNSLHTPTLCIHATQWCF